MSLTSNQLHYLRKMSHNAKPVVIVGSAGLTESVIEEISSSLRHHELMKVRVNASDKKVRKEMIDKICLKTESSLVFAIGHIASFYRQAEPN